MKNALFAILVTFTIISCKDDKRKYNNKNQDIEKLSNKISLIEHPYIFEKHEFKIEDFTAEKLNESDKFLFSFVISGDIGKFEKDHRIFVHGFNKENNKEYLVNFVMKKTKRKEDKLIFYSEYTPKYSSIEILRFGITNLKSKKRLFVLSVEDVIF